MRAHLRSLGACTLLMGTSVPAWADEPPDPAVTDPRSPATRYDDETQEPHRVTHLWSATDARSAADGGARIVAHLPSGALVTVVASRGDTFLVAFDDPDGLSARTLGWIPLDALLALDAETSAEAPVPSRTWYGWQMLVADGASVTLSAVGFTMLKEDTSGSTVALALGVGMYGVGTPLIHRAHHNPWTALGSFGMRTVPMVGGAALIVATSGRGEGGSATMLLISAATLVVSAIDAFVLAYDTTPAPPKPQGRLMPTVVPTKDGATLGLVGSF